MTDLILAKQCRVTEVKPLVTTDSVPRCRWILQGLQRLRKWACIRFKPAKSRSLLLKRGKVVDSFCFSIAGAAIPIIMEKLVKSLCSV